MSELSLQSNPVKLEILPEGLRYLFSNCISSSSRNTCQRLTQWYQLIMAISGYMVTDWTWGTERDAVWSSGPEWEDQCSHFWSAAHHYLLIIVKGLISDPAGFIFSFVSFLSFVSSAQCRPCCTSSSVILAACWVCDSSAWRHYHHSDSLPHSFAHFYIFLFFRRTLSSDFAFVLPGCFLVLYFHRCQSLLLKACVNARPSQRVFPPSRHTVFIC